MLSNIQVRIMLARDEIAECRAMTLLAIVISESPLSNMPAFAHDIAEPMPYNGLLLHYGGAKPWTSSTRRQMYRFRISTMDHVQYEHVSDYEDLQ